MSTSQDVLKCVWVFMGDNATQPAAVFTSRPIAERWISANRVSGMLTSYPVDMPVYEWAIDRGLFVAAGPHHTEPKFKARFSSAYSEHYHYEDGELIA